MYSINLSLILCLSLALIEINAYVRVYPTSGPTTQYEAPTERSWTTQHPNGPHHHHHHRHHHGGHGHVAPARDWQQSEVHGPHKSPPHQMMLQIWPLFHSLLNREYTKNGKMDSTDEQQLDTRAKATAYIKSKVQIKLTESVMERDSNGNGSKIITKTLEQKGETDAVIEMNSNLDVISDKVLKAKSEEESKPVESETEKSVESLKPGYNNPMEVLPKMAVYQKRPQLLRRMKRETNDHDDADKKSDKEVDKFFEGVKKVAKEVVKGLKKFGEHIDKTVIQPIKKSIEEGHAKHKQKHPEREAHKKKEQQHEGADEADAQSEK